MVSSRKFKKPSTKSKFNNKIVTPRRNTVNTHSFLSIDAAYLNSHPIVELGEKIAEGNFGDVFFVHNNQRLIIKVPEGVSGVQYSKYNSQQRRNMITRSVIDLEREAKMYQKCISKGISIVIPTQIVGINCGICDNVIGLARPYVTPVYDYAMPIKPSNLRRLTDSRVIEIKDKLLELSYNRCGITDGLQIGLDLVGRPFLYDLGFLAWYDNDAFAAYRVNNHAWKDFLKATGKDIKKLGQIKRE